jgi:plastocyanin
MRNAVWAGATGALSAISLIGVMGVGCQQRSAPREPTPLDLATTGTITGVVRFAGTPPAQTTLQLSSSAECAALYDGPVLAGDVLVAEGQVQNAIVYIAHGLGDRVFAVPDAPVVIDQQRCLFHPRVTAAQVGQPVRFLNSDALGHNVHGVPAEARGWNFMLPVKGASRETTIDTEEPAIEIKCDIHPWMTAYIGVFDHPYFAVTGADGRFTLSQVPPGEYAVGVWHERLGMQRATVTLGPQGTEDLTLTLPGQ